MNKDILINIAKKSIERKFNNKINIDINTRDGYNIH